MAVPDEFADGIALVGPKTHIRERLAAWKTAAAEGSVTALLLAGAGREEIRFPRRGVALATAPVGGGAGGAP